MTKMSKMSKKSTKTNKFISGFDSYNLCLTGDVGRTLATPSGGLNEHIPVIVLNDQGGSVMYVSDVPSTLRAESHQHEPIICFEPGIVKREGSDSRFVDDMCGTLRADMGDNQPAVCYGIDSHPMDSRFQINGDLSPTVTAKLAKGSADGPLVMIENE